MHENVVFCSELYSPMHFINVQMNKLIFLNIQDISLKIDCSNPPGWFTFRKFAQNVAKN